MRALFLEFIICIIVIIVWYEKCLFFLPISAGLKLNRCIMLLEEFLLQHRLGVILTEQSAINKDNDTSIVLWTADGRTQQWDTLVAEMAALPDKMANKLKTENR